MQIGALIVARSQSGAGGSTSVLTERGKELLERYNAYDRKLKELAGELYGEYFGGMFE